MSNVRLMIVEDEVIIAMDIKRRVLSLGYEVVASASAGQECLEKLETVKPDLILMDIFLKGGIDGIETAEIIKTKFNIPVIYLTAHADEKTLQRAKITQPYGYILKPFEVRDLQTMIEIALYKHLMEAKLRKAHDELEERVEERTIEIKALTDQSPFPICIYSMTGEIVYVNKAWEKLWNSSLDKLQTSGYNVFSDKLFIYFGYGHEIKRVFTQGGNIKTKPLYFDPVEFPGFKDTDGKLLIINFYSLKNEKGKVFRVVSFMEDITERVKAEEINHELESRKKSSEVMLNKIEEERSRISRDLHDSIGQMLSAVKFNIEVYEKSNSIENKQLQEARRLISAAGKELKSIIHSLHPVSIDNYGMIPAIGILVKEFSEANTHTSLKFETEGFEERLDSKIELNIFRIIQEALNNIAKHSGATSAELVLCIQLNVLSIIIRDNGKGFIISNLNEYSKSNSSFGLINMKERTEILKGNFNIISAPDRGTEINIEIPLVSPDY